MKPTQTLKIDPALIWPAVTTSPVLWRYTVYLMLVGLMVLFYTWSRLDARETGLALSRARSHAEIHGAQNQRLQLELAVLTGSVSLDARGTAIGLVPAAEVVEVR